MSAVTDPAVPADVVDLEPPAPAVERRGRSAKDRAAARRQELFAERSFVLPVGGYEGIYAARYKVLSYEELRVIGNRVEKIPGLSGEEREVTEFADTLIRACEELLEVSEDGTYQSLGQRWTADAVREHFGIDLPDKTTARNALRAVMPSTVIALHFRAYDREMSASLQQVDGLASGEPEPSSEG